MALPAFAAEHLLLSAGHAVIDGHWAHSGVA